MLKEEIKKIYDERVIKWLTIESEVMTEVLNRVIIGEITETEWNEYFIDLVNTHGTATMYQQVKAFVKIQESFRELMGLGKIGNALVDTITELNELKEPINTSKPNGE